MTITIADRITEWVLEASEVSGGEDGIYILPAEKWTWDQLKDDATNVGMERVLDKWVHIDCADGHVVVFKAKPSDGVRWSIESDKVMQLVVELPGKHQPCTPCTLVSDTGDPYELTVRRTGDSTLSTVMTWGFSWYLSEKKGGAK